MGWEEHMIKVTGIDKESIRDQGTRETWVIPFKLSAKPDESWEKHFYGVHAKVKNMDKPTVKIINDILEVSFSQTTSLQHVVDQLKAEVEEANAAFKEIFLKKMKLQQDLKDYQDQQAGALRKIKDDVDKLKF